MEKLGIHSFVWTGGTTQQELEGAMEKSHRLGYKLIEFPRLDPKKFDVSWLARRLADYELKVTVTMGLPLDGDISSEDVTPGVLEVQPACRLGDVRLGSVALGNSGCPAGLSG